MMVIVTWWLYFVHAITDIIPWFVGMYCGNYRATMVAMMVMIVGYGTANGDMYVCIYIYTG